MLNFALKGTYQDPSGYSWDYYGDDQLDPNPNPNNFYIIPQPQFVLQENSNSPVFSIVTNSTDGNDNGSGTCQFEVELSVPQKIQDAISAAIVANKTTFPNVTKPIFITLQWNQGGSAGFTLTTDGVASYFTAPVSGFGGNVASFLLSLTPKQMATCSAAFSNPGGSSSIEVTYNLSVPARLRGVTAVLTFDSSLAYQYQVTQPTYNGWGDQTSPGSVQGFLKASNSSKVDLTWGVATPPQYLVTEVTNWANSTIAAMVNAEVQKETALLGEQSSTSFNINEVSNFTATFNENMVIDWVISPSATLPSFPGMGLNIANFSTSVNERQQVMVVTTNLPFATPPGYENTVPQVPVSGGGYAPALVKSVDVTVQYPGLSQANGTFTFNLNGSHTFTTGYDLSQGPEWTLVYTVNYVNPLMNSVSGTISNIQTGACDITVLDAGILSVEFDATNVFSTGTNIPKEVVIEFNFADNNSIPFNYTLKLYPNNMTGVITSLQATPATNPYNYQVTYIYPTGAPFPSPLITNQTGTNQVIYQAAQEHTLNLIIFVPANSVAQGTEIFDGNINLWYDTPPNLPSWYPVTELPTQATPTLVTITPNPDSTGNLFGRGTFQGIITGNEPLYYDATIDTSNGSITTGLQIIANSQPSIMIDPLQEYFTLEIDPSSIDWATNGLTEIQVLVTIHIALGTSPNPANVGDFTQPTLHLYTGSDTGNNFYMTQGYQKGNVATYDCTVNYKTKGGATKSFTVTGQPSTDNTFNIPASTGAVA